MDHSLPGSSVHGILQARILEWVAMLSSRESSQPRDWNPHLLHLLHWRAGFFTISANWEGPQAGTTGRSLSMDLQKGSTYFGGYKPSWGQYYRNMWHQKYTQKKKHVIVF